MINGHNLRRIVLLSIDKLLKGTLAILWQLWKITMFNGKLTNLITMFNGYVELPEGI